MIMCIHCTANGVGDDCENDCDADGVPDRQDACPCNKQIQKANFKNFKSIALDRNRPGKPERFPIWALTANGSEITQQAMNNHPSLLLGLLIIISWWY